jgi:hypothetical protein
VFVNGRPALRVDDMGIHAVCCGPNLWRAQKGSASVFINGKPAFRINDPSKHCGAQGKLIEGSSDVFVGDASTSGAARDGAAHASTNSSSGGAGSGGGGASSSAGRQSRDSRSNGAQGSGGADASRSAATKADSSDSSSSAVAADEIEVIVLDAAGKPCKALFYELTLPDGAKRTGKTDDNGRLKITALVQKGDCTLKLPDIDAAQQR